jgi:hypothetical protein
MPLCPQITITPITVTSTGMTQTSIIPIVAATTEETDELQVEINSIEASVNGKNHIYRQATAPDGSVYPLTEGDVWFDTDDGNKQYYWTGLAWVSVQDLGIQAAEDAAAAASSAAAAASAAAASATAAAAAADAAAVAAQTTANGKNKIVRSTADASGTTGYSAGDLWWKMASTSTASNVLDQWTFDGSVWNKNALTNAVIATLDAAKITTGYLAADRIEAATITGAKMVAGTIEAVSIAANTITGAKLAAGTIEAVSIAASTITGAKIAASTITAGNIAAATITADQIAGATITAAEIAAETITAAEIAADSITVDRLTAGTLTAFTLQTSTGARRVTISAANNAISFREASTTVGWVGPTSITGIIMHYGSTFNAAATAYPQAYVSSGDARIAYNSTTYVQTSSTGVVCSGNLYSLTNFYNQDSTTTANAANTWMSATNGLTRRSTASSQRYKENIVELRTVANLDPTKLLDLPVRAFTYKSDYLDSEDDRAGLMLPGFIAEEVAAIYPIAADKVDGTVESWNDRFIVPGMLALIQDLNARINILEGNANG